MSIATRLDVNMGHWMPVTRIYAVDGGHLAVTVANFLTATGTTIHYCDEYGVAVGDSMQSIADFPDGTSHTKALESLGYTVVDDIGEESPEEQQVTTQSAEESVLNMLPPEIAAMIAAPTTTEENPA